MKKVITPSGVPKAAGPYSHAILHDSKFQLEISGQIGIDLAAGKLVEGGIEAETEQALANVNAILTSVGWGFGNVIKARVYLSDMKDYAAMNAVYGRHFPKDAPARVAVAVKQLPLGALVEIECTAAGNEARQ